MKASTKSSTSGSLQIGDQWNAIRILASSQTHSLKAICELVENAIDARATTIELVRYKHGGDFFLEVSDNGVGVRRTDGKPDFNHLATHVCDSMKRKLNEQERIGVHGEFGIGLLSFWSLGDALRMVSGDKQGGLWELTLHRGEQDFSIEQIRGEPLKRGTRVTVGPLLEATRNIVTGEKIQKYLAVELRDRIRDTAVVITIDDRAARKDYLVKPHEFSGERLAELPTINTPHGPLVAELYLRDGTHEEPGRVALCKDGTRVLEDITELVSFSKRPWTDGRLEGILEYSAFNLAPGTRKGIIPDKLFDAFVTGAGKLEDQINEVIKFRDQAASARANRKILVQVKKAFLGALRELEDQYLYFDIPQKRKKKKRKHESDPRQRTLLPDLEKEAVTFKPGTLASVMITPRHSRRPPSTECLLKAEAFDCAGPITEKCSYEWKLIDGIARITSTDGPSVKLVSPVEGRVVLEVTATRGNRVVTDRVSMKFLDRDTADIGSDLGLPTYRLQAARGEPWRSRYQVKTNEIVINSAHRDFVSSKTTSAKHRRYIGKLYAKEVVLLNFPHESSAMAMERLIEVIVRTEDLL